MNENIFREYDIRGIVDEDLTPESVATLAHAIGTFFARNGARRVAVGYDARESSPFFFELLSRGFNDCGVDVVSIGMVPTPVLYHTAFTKPVDGGVMITGSHNPANHNGFKICLGKSTLFGPQIQEIKQIALALSPGFSRPAATAGGEASLNERTSSSCDGPPEGGTQNGGTQSGTIETVSVLDDYVADVVAGIRMGPRRLRAVVDGGNGMGGVTAVPVYRALGVDLVELYTEPDSRFPNHHPDPTVTENLIDVIEAVTAYEADLGIAFDGDGDRIGVVDETGRIIWGDELMVLLSRSILAERPGATIIAEVKCSQNLFDDIARHGGTPVMWKAGHSLIKSKMKETNAALAGEMSGHIFFADRFYGFDDATYAGARLLEILSSTDLRLSELLADLPPSVSTPELRVPCPDELKFDIVARVSDHFSRTNEVITIDGARILFEHGWGLVRASNTQAILVLRFEADSPEHLDEIRDIVEHKVDEFISAAAAAN